MAVKVKKGMGGSNGGRGRYERTETLKSMSSKRRRQEGKRQSGKPCDEHGKLIYN